MSQAEQLIPRPIENLFGNKEKWQTVSTPPDREHYPHTFLWDSAFHTIVYAHYGFSDAAATEIGAVLAGQDESGFIPNMTFGPGRRFDPERRTFNNPEKSSDYTQPPLLAHSALATFKSFESSGRGGEGIQFVKNIFGSLDKFYEYFEKYRKNPDTGLIGVIHPHETGRDSDPTFDFSKFRFPQPPIGAPLVRGIVDKINTGADYFGALKINLKHKKNKWDNASARGVFWVEDVMFNAIYAQNLRYMATLAQRGGNTEKEVSYNSMADSTEEAILNNLWDGETQTFKALNPTGKIDTLSVSNLFPVVLDSVAEHQVEGILHLLSDPKKFNTEYPIPSVAVDNKAYDPQASEKRLWRGPVWMNMNWYITMGLLKQRDRFAGTNEGLSRGLNLRALNIARKSAKLVNEQGYREFYSPRDGKGMRVKNFGWSTLGDVIKDAIPDMEAFEISYLARQ